MNAEKIDWKLILAAVSVLAVFINYVITFDRRITTVEAGIASMARDNDEDKAASREYRAHLDKRFETVDNKLDRIIERGR